MAYLTQFWEINFCGLMKNHNNNPEWGNLVLRQFSSSTIISFTQNTLIIIKIIHFTGWYIFLLFSSYDSSDSDNDKTVMILFHYLCETKGLAFIVLNLVLFAIPHCRWFLKSLFKEVVRILFSWGHILSQNQHLIVVELYF